MTSTNPGVWLKRGFFTLRKHSARRKVLIQSPRLRDSGATLGFFTLRKHSVRRKVLIQSPRLRDSGATFYLRVVAPATVTQKF